MLASIIERAHKHHASDVHLEPGLPIAFRIGGNIQKVGEPLEHSALLNMAQRMLGAEGWKNFLVRRSADLATSVAGVSCRLNVFQTSRGVGLAIRLLAASVPTIAGLNLHPDVARLVEAPHGLILITGPTGSGKSSTLAALIQHINRRDSRHILTIEAPIEYHYRSETSFIRQREVGRDTPSFEQALTDALREDPDVIVVGEMRRRDTMQLTLDAAETGHLVVATMHASSVAEALQRIVGAFPSESQGTVRAQLAECFVAGISQTLAYHPVHKLRVPECEILTSATSVAAHIRDGSFFKLAQAMSTGASAGMWTRQRYRRWVSELSAVSRPKRDAVARERDASPPTGLPPIPSSDSTPAQDATIDGAPAIDLDDATSLEAVIAELNKR